MKCSSAWLVFVALLPLAPLAAPAQEPVGRVTSLAGEVRAAGPGGGRALACGDAVYAGDTVTTGDGATAGILMDDILARVEGGSALRVDRGEAGEPDTLLQKGRVRLIDAREEGAAPARLAARDARVRVAGNDAEAYVLSEKVGPYAMFCEWDAPLEVARDGQREVARPNQCVIAKDTEPLYVADAHEERIPADAGTPCPPDLAALSSPGPHFSPIATRGVGAGPPPLLSWSEPALGPILPTPDPCDDPGSGCGLSGAGGIVIDEPTSPPVEDPIGGGGPPIGSP